MPPLSPMLARLADDIPTGPGWLYEPKWDGFRALVFKDGNTVAIYSRNGKPMGDRFTEVSGAASGCLPGRCVLDGEMVVARDGKLTFDGLLTRFDRRAERPGPASFVAFDLIAVGDEDLRSLPFAERRARLETTLVDCDRLLTTPQTDDVELARRWLRELFAQGFEGIVAKRGADPYRSGTRAVVKVKRWETVDAVVGGYRGEAGAPTSLLLGLYDDAGVLHHVGATTVISESSRAEVAAALAPLAEGTSFGGGLMPGRSRWQSARFDEWVHVAPGLVCEVAYNRLDGRTFRHSARLVRIRTDKSPRECTYDQLG